MDFKFVPDATHKIETYTINRFTAGGTRRQIRPAAWPETNILKLSFSKLSAQEKVDLLAFLEEKMGKTITITDSNGIRYSGMIITSVFTFTQKYPSEPNTDCDTGIWSTEFEFEGEVA